MENISISVIISIYNIADYIACCVDSVLKQSYQPLEILLINDGSTDHSYEVCFKFQQEYPDLVHVISKENGGLSSARNAGIKAAKGEYLYFIDGDDYILPETLQDFASIVSTHDRLDFIHGRMSYFSEEHPEPITQPYYLDESWFASDDGSSNGKLEGVPGQIAFADAYKHQGALAMGVRGLYRREFIIKNSLMFMERSISWGEDEEWTPRVFWAAKKVTGTDQPNYCYRQNRPDSETIKMLNLQTGLVMLETYNDWLALAALPDNEEVFCRALRKEAGGRYVALIDRYGYGLSKEERDVFFSRADEYHHLLCEYKPGNLKTRVGKVLLYLFGGRAMVINNVIHKMKGKR